MTKHRIFTMAFSKVYPAYVAKAEKKARTKAEVDEIICWLTGYDPATLQEQLDKQTDFETFFDQAPALNPDRRKITGVVCGIRVENIEVPSTTKWASRKVRTRIATSSATPTTTTQSKNARAPSGRRRPAGSGGPPGPSTDGS